MLASFAQTPRPLLLHLTHIVQIAVQQLQLRSLHARAQFVVTTICGFAPNSRTIAIAGVADYRAICESRRLHRRTARSTSHHSVVVVVEHSELTVGGVKRVIQLRFWVPIIAVIVVSSW